VTWRSAVRTAVVLAACAASAACGRSPARPLAGPSPGTANTRPPPPDAGATVELGAGLRGVRFVPGRYATVIHRRLSGTHARQLVRETSSASLAITLTSGGAAQACRGWRDAMTNDGPQIHTDDQFREQAGFAGRWRADGDAIVVELTSDAAVCAAIAEGRLPRARATALTLRCARAEPAGHPHLTTPVLVCRWDGAPSPEREAHALDDLGPADAIVLGAAPGLRVTVTGAPPRLVGAPRSLAVTSEAAADDAWSTGG
jgi:hypothetical protein